MYEEEETSTIRGKLRNEVDTFINRDDNSITCPDKGETRLRYQLDFRHILRETFLTETGILQFCWLILCNNGKPKPQDRGTCLCMTSLIPQLKQQGLNLS